MPIFFQKKANFFSKKSQFFNLILNIIIFKTFVLIPSLRPNLVIFHLITKIIHKNLIFIKNKMSNK